MTWAGGRIVAVVRNGIGYERHRYGSGRAIADFESEECSIVVVAKHRSVGIEELASVAPSVESVTSSRHDRDGSVGGNAAQVLVRVECVQVAVCWVVRHVGDIAKVGRHAGYLRKSRLSQVIGDEVSVVAERTNSELSVGVDSSRIDRGDRHASVDGDPIGTDPVDAVVVAMYGINIVIDLVVARSAQVLAGVGNQVECEWVRSGVDGVQPGRTSAADEEVEVAAAHKWRATTSNVRVVGCGVWLCAGFGDGKWCRDGCGVRERSGCGRVDVTRCRVGHGRA